MRKKQTNMNVVLTTYRKVSKRNEMYKKFNCFTKKSSVATFFELAIRKCRVQIGTYKLGFVYIWDLKSHIPKGERLEKVYLWALLRFWQPSNSNSEVLHIRCRRCC